MAGEYAPTRILCSNPECEFDKTYAAWTIACLAASRHTGATGHVVNVEATRFKTFAPGVAVAR